MKNHQILLVLNVLKSLCLHFYSAPIFLPDAEIRKIIAKRDQLRNLKEIAERLQVHSNKPLKEYLEKIRTDAKLAVQLYLFVGSTKFIVEFGESLKENYFIIDFSDEHRVGMFPAVFPVENPQYPTADISDESWERLCNTQEITFRMETENGEPTLLNCPVNYHKP